MSETGSTGEDSLGSMSAQTLCKWRRKGVGDIRLTPAETEL